MGTRQWKNRIVRHADVDPSDLLANPENWRVHPKHQQDALKGVIDEVGFVSPVLVQDGTDVVVDGHMRVTLALRDNVPTIPVAYLDLNDNEMRTILATLDPISALAIADKEQLDHLLREVTTSDAAVMQMLADLAEQEGVVSFNDEPEGLTDPDDVPEPPVDPITKPGDLWTLGRHRLLCGDSTNRADVDRLMNGEKADMVFTDPPYALFGNSTGVAGITDDKMTRPFFLEVFKQSRHVTKRFAHIYVCCDWHSAFSLQAMAKQAGLTEKNLCIWDKGDGGVGAMYQQCYEMIWFFANSPAASTTMGRTPAGERTVNGKPNIWRFGRVQGDRLHNAQKPTEMVAFSIKNSSDVGDVVVDLFGGSGSTLIACQETERNSYLMELEPAYCDVIVQRWENYTGETASREAAS